MLNQLNTSYGRQYSGLFQHYLPNIGPMMTENDLQAQMEEERRVQVWKPISSDIVTLLLCLP